MACRRVTQFLKGRHVRTVRTTKNIVASVGLKGLNIATQVVLVPLMLNYLSPAKYGVLMTVVSVMQWFVLFDLGLGYGLKFRFAEKMAKAEHHAAHIYVSTAFVTLTAIVGFLSVILLSVHPYIKWAGIFNAPAELEDQISRLMLFIIIFLSLRMIFGLTGMMLSGDQNNALSDGITSFANVVSLGAVYALTLFSKGSLFYMGLTITITSALAPMAATWWFFRRQYCRYRPQIGLFQLDVAFDLTKTGINFFLMGITSLVTFLSASIIIAHVLGPEEVAIYNITFRYFSLVTVGWYVILTPFAAAFTDALHKDDLPWIDGMLRKLKAFWLVQCFGVVGMVLLSNWVYNLWIGSSIVIPWTVSAWMGIYALLSNWNQIFFNLASGIGKVRLNLLSLIVSSLVYVPLAIILTKNFGCAGAIAASGTSLLQAVLLPIQYQRILRKQAKGIWNR